MCSMRVWSGPEETKGWPASRMFAPAATCEQGYLDRVPGLPAWLTHSVTAERPQKPLFRCVALRHPRPRREVDEDPRREVDPGAPRARGGPRRLEGRGLGAVHGSAAGAGRLIVPPPTYSRERP